MNIINLKLRKGIAVLAAAGMVLLGAPVAFADHADIHMSGAAAVVLTQNGGTVIETFLPDLGLDLSTSANHLASSTGSATAYYGINVVSSTSSTDVHWKITVDHATEALASGDVTIVEVGTFNASSGQVRETPATYSTSESSGNLILTGDISGWALSDEADFTNVDRITFSASAPEGTYTITRVLVNEVGGDTDFNDSFSFTINFDREEDTGGGDNGPDVEIAGAANGTAIFNGNVDSPTTLSTSTPDLDLKSSLNVNLETSTTTGVTAYYGVDATLATTTSTEFVDRKLQWKIIVDHEEGLTGDDVQIEEIGYHTIMPSQEEFISVYDPDNPFSYNVVGIVSGNLVLEGHGGSLDGAEGLIITSVDEITFSADAPLGTYTITRILTVPSLDVELDNSFTFTITLHDGEEEIETPAAESITVISPTLPHSTSTNPITLTGTTTATGTLTVTGGASSASTTVEAEATWSLSVTLNEDVINNLTLTLTGDEDEVLATTTIAITHETEATTTPPIPPPSGGRSGGSRAGGFARAAQVTPAFATIPGNAFGLQMIQGFIPVGGGEVLGAATVNDPVRAAQIQAIRAQLAQLITQLISRLQAQLNLQLAGSGSGNVSGTTVSAAQ
jgi:flagellar basal body rod protein FlgC